MNCYNIKRFLILVYTKDCTTNEIECINDDTALADADCQALGSITGGAIRYTCGCLPGLVSVEDQSTCKGRLFCARMASIHQMLTVALSLAVDYGNGFMNGRFITNVVAV